MPTKNLPQTVLFLQQPLFPLKYLLSSSTYAIDNPRIIKQNSRLVYGGGVPERSKGSDCKSDGLRLRRFESFPLHTEFWESGRSSMVELQPSKLIAWVRFPSPAGFCAHIAQSVEHFLGKEEVTGSSPVVGF